MRGKMDVGKSTHIEIIPKGPQDRQGISYSMVAFGKFGDITDYSGQSDASDTFIPKERCVHRSA